MTSDAPLKGIVVVEIGHSVAAPFAALVLGQLGAEVIKIERPEGGDNARGWGPPMRSGASGLFHAMNREKRSVALELHEPQEREQLVRLIMDRADVVIQNFRPNSIEALGLGAAEMTGRKLGLIYCNLSAFGGIGPLASSPGYDPLMQTYGGLMGVTGEEGRPAVRVGVSIIDIGTGLWSVIGILAALSERARTGLGGIIDTSLYETALSWMGIHIAEFSATGVEPRRHGSGAAQIVPYEMFATSDGHLMIAAGNDSLFVRLCGVLGEPQLVRDERFRTNVVRVQNRTQLTKLLQTAFRTRSSTHWRALLDDAGVPNAPLRTLSEVTSDPQTQALGILQHLAGLGLTTVGLPIRFNGRRPQLQRIAPQLGEHSRELVGELGGSGSVSEHMVDTVLLREVGLRDGLQIIKTFLPTPQKKEWIDRCAAAGFRELEVGSFVPEKYIPQFRDVQEVCAHARGIAGLRAAALVPNLKGAQRALEAGVDTLICITSATESFSAANLRRSRAQSTEELQAIVRLRDQVASNGHRARIQVGISVSFGCPFAGRVRDGDVIAAAMHAAQAGAEEISLADTSGQGDPGQVRRIFTRLLQELPHIGFSAHFHDTRGTGLANVVAALEAGVRSFDASIGGLGGCPNSPGATGNIVMEDAVFMLEAMGLDTGIDLERLFEVRRFIVEQLPGVAVFGHLATVGLPPAFVTAAAARLKS